MARNNGTNPRLTSYIESLLRPSVVLIVVNEKESQTGFFVSKSGLICTSYHGLNFSSQVSVQWNGRSYTAETIFRSATADLALLALKGLDGSNGIKPLPISCDAPPGSQNRHAAASLGYAGWGTFGTNKEPKMPIGELTIKYDYNEHQERFEIYRISGGKGHSGSPVIDLHRFRVLGYVQSSYSTTGQQIGHALTFKTLVRQRPELLEEWALACHQFDLDLAHYYLDSPFAVDLEHCPAGLISSIVSIHSKKAFDCHGDKELFQSNRYVPRAVDTDIDYFLNESTDNLLLLSGASGAGKTSFVLNLTQRINHHLNLPVLIKCKGLQLGNLLQTAFNTVLPIEHFELRRFGQLLDRCPDKRWLLIFDGLNECAGFSKPEFRELVDTLRSLVNTRATTLKIIFSLRTEFLREYLQSFFFWQGSRHDALDTNILQGFYRDDRGRPYVRLGRINKMHLPDGRLELEAMYEQYRETGLKPVTSFKQLSEPIRRMLDRPFVLSLMMKAYHGAEVPLTMGRSALIREIVDQTLEKAGIEQEIEVAGMKRYLSRLAAFVLRGRGDLSCLDSDLEIQTWNKDAYLAKVLANTPFVNRETIQGSSGTENLIRFQADWTFEFFLGSYLAEEWWRQNSHKDMAELVHELHLLLPKKTTKSDPQHLLVALLFFAEWAATDDPSRFSFLVSIMNDSQHSSFANAFLRETLDFFRITYGFEQQFQSPGESSYTVLDLFSRSAEYFGETAAEGLLDYVEHLETISKYDDALLLLNHDGLKRTTEENSALQARHQLSLALNSFFNHYVDVALSFANAVNREVLPLQLQAKHAFVVGRVHQYKEEFLQADKEFQIGRQVRSLYGYRCEHQIPFISILAESDFVAALAQLERTLKNSFFGISPELKFESRVLKATCLFRVGRYQEASDELLEIIKFSGGQRNSNRLGKTLRVLAELHSRRFDYEQANSTIEKAIEALDRSPALSLAAALDIKANILGLLRGDLDAARKYNTESLRLCQDKKHRGTRQWCLQTSALLAALKGNLDETSHFLDKAGANNPLERLLRQFILLLAIHRSGQHTVEFQTDILKLRAQFEELQLAWYPQVLSLVSMAAVGGVPRDVEISTLFPAPVDLAGLTNSYLYTQIFAAR
jgi:tetratricopeptide (TPR) repeat protein